MVIKWNKKAIKQLLEAITFIEDSGFSSYAKELELNVLSRIRRLPQNPKLYIIDRYKRNNDGSFYAFEYDRYRVSYRLKKKEIRIIRIRHTSRKTLNY